MPIQFKIDRAQVQFLALEQIAEQDSIVRIIDLFCQCIDYENLGFIVKGKSHEGKPTCQTATLNGIQKNNSYVTAILTTTHSPKHQTDHLFYYSHNS